MRMFLFALVEIRLGCMAGAKAEEKKLQGLVSSWVMGHGVMDRAGTSGGVTAWAFFLRPGVPVLSNYKFLFMLPCQSSANPSPNIIPGNPDCQKVFSSFFQKITRGQNDRRAGKALALKVID